MPEISKKISDEAIVKAAEKDAEAKGGDVDAIHAADRVVEKPPQETIGKMLSGKICTEKQVAAAKAEDKKATKKITKKGAKVSSQKRGSVQKKKGVTKKVKADKATGGLCGCGCGEEVKKHYKQGHDGRFHGRVIKLKEGEMTIAELRKLGVKPYGIKLYEEAIA